MDKVTRHGFDLFLDSEGTELMIDLREEGLLIRAMQEMEDGVICFIASTQPDVKEICDRMIELSKGLPE